MNSVTESLKGFHSNDVIGKLILDELRFIREEMKQEVRKFREDLRNIFGERLDDNFIRILKENQREADDSNMQYGDSDDQYEEHMNHDTDENNVTDASSHSERIKVNVGEANDTSCSAEISSMSKTKSNLYKNTEQNDIDVSLPLVRCYETTNTPHLYNVKTEPYIVEKSEPQYIKADPQESDFRRPTMIKNVEFVSSVLLNNLSTNEKHILNKSGLLERNEPLLKRNNKNSKEITVCRLHGKTSFQSHNLLQIYSKPNRVKVEITEKNKKCMACNKSFRTGFALKRHIRIHTDERPYRCEICYKSFSRRDHLMKHRKTGDHKHMVISCGFAN